VDSSAFKQYAFGKAANNKELNSNLLEVTPIEILPLLNGRLNTETEELTYEGVNAEGISEKLTINIKSSITCKWLQWGSNRDTAPDVRRGERIMIYRYADSVDQFYWVPTGLDEHLRRLETVVWLFSADPDGLSDEGKTAENSYSISVSTHSKQITIQTVKLNNEPYAYTIQINADYGALVFQDDVGNYIQLDSPETKITLMNADTTEVSLDKKNLYMYAPDSYKAVVENTYRIECKDYELIASNSIDLQTKSYTAQANDLYKVTTNVFDIVSPESKFSGNVSVGGDATVTGTFSASKGSIGGVSFDNGVMTCRTLNASQNITAPNV
jgi:hypothetical protein